VFYKTLFCPDGVELPYKITTEKPRYSIGIFGDSFAQLAEHADHSGSKLDKNKAVKQENSFFTHEFSYIYYLSKLLNVECHAWGLSGVSIADSIDVLLNSPIEYDYYIVWGTAPSRENIFSNLKISNSLYLKLIKKLENKNTLLIYPYEKWEFYKNLPFEKYYSNYHITNINQTESEHRQISANPLDQLGSYHHMSNRGNLLLAIELSKIIDKGYRSCIK